MTKEERVAHTKKTEGTCERETPRERDNDQFTRALLRFCNNMTVAFSDISLAFAVQLKHLYACEGKPRPGTRFVLGQTKQPFYHKCASSGPGTQLGLALSVV